MSAVREMNLAEGVVVRLPELHAAMFSGRVDRTRAWFLWSMTQHMSQAHARAVCAKLLPKCHTWTSGQLKAKIAKTAIALDPAWQEARQKATLKERRVVGSMNDDGTADLCGYSLPPERVIAAMGRMDELAKSAKRSGDPRGIDFLRAELYAGLLDGTFEGLSDEEILLCLAFTRPTDEELAAEAAAEAAARAAAEPVAAAAAQAEAAAQTEAEATRAAAEAAEHVGAEEAQAAAEAAEHAETEEAQAAAEAAEHAEAEEAQAAAENARAEESARAAAEERSEADATAHAEAAEAAAREGEAATETGPEAVETEPEAAAGTGTEAPAGRVDGLPGSWWLREHDLPEPPRIGLELQVRLSTLLGLDEAPAELAGWGPIHPTYARDLCAELGPAQWRYALTDGQGYLITAGLTPARPIGVRLRRWACRAIVELQVPETLLRAIRSGELTACQVRDPAMFAAWAPVITDIARRIEGPGGVGANTPTGPKPLDPRRRTPAAALRRDVQIRKRRCMAPGCRAPARTTDIDHTLDHARGGDTIGINLEPLCRHHHRMKHEGGWTLRFLPEENTYLWRSRLGIEYRVPIPQIIEELPEPHHDPDPDPIYQPRTDPARDLNGTPWQDSVSWYQPPPPAPEPPPPPPRPTTDEVPPF